MAATKAASSLITSQSLSAGSSKTSPGITGSAVDCRTNYGGELTWKITNGSSAPGVAASITFQISPDSTAWFDYYTVGGDTTASSINSGSILLDRGVMYVRAIAYGNTTNAVTVEAGVQAVTGV